MKILVMNGPNLNLLGKREPGVYGTETLASIEGEIAVLAEKLGIEVEFFQSNHEGAIIDALHGAMDTMDGVILNAGAYTHYSYAIRDAIAAIKIPVIEVHISNVFARDDFRSNSVIAPVCKGSISGFGFGSYYLAVQALSEL